MLDARSESLLKWHFGSGQTAFEGSPSGALLERALLYGAPLRKRPALDRKGRVIRDRELEAVRAQWLAFRKRAKAYALGHETLVAWWGFCLTERPWKTHETLPRLAAVYDEVDRLYAAWEAGEVPSEAGLRTWIKRDVLPLRAGHVTPDLTARPTAETRSSNATEPAGRDLLKMAGASRALQRMGRAKKLVEVQALESLYGAPGEHFMDQGLPRHLVLATQTEAGVRLLARLPKSGALARWYEQLANHWHARDSVSYAQHAEAFAATEIACSRLEARACRAWDVAREGNV